MTFEHSLFVAVRHDPVFLQVTPQAVGVSKDIAQRRVIQPERLALLTGRLPRLLQTHLRPPAKSHIGDAAFVANPQAPGLSAGRMYAQSQTVTICHDISLFLRSESRNFFEVKAMSETNLKTAYEWDAAGYYLGETVWMLDDFGDWLEAPSSTDVCPWTGEPDGSVFYKRLDGKWTTEKKPTCAAECIGLSVPHDSMTTHDIELRNLIRTLGEEEGYRVARGDDLSWYVEKIPEPTEKEKREAAEAEVRLKRDELLSETDYLLMPDYPITAKSLEAVKKYRQALRDITVQKGFPFTVEWPVLEEVCHE